MTCTGKVSSPRRSWKLLIQTLKEWAVLKDKPFYSPLIQISSTLGLGNPPIHTLVPWSLLLPPLILFAHISMSTSQHLPHPTLRVAAAGSEMLVSHYITTRNWLNQLTYSSTNSFVHRRSTAGRNDSLACYA